ncbi:hypothetical protein GCM10011529_05120 [Polymorphobacter glacialis]|uniref:Uncharacterized protein n=1 Tax=Sandarakinorhabdus glacialis TaxID=1614636 RepID=A0A916ZK33_9SPHN|nr:hypothetical protein [Polymorphobacter glacialis]GGE01739.1 hypothetical protein GCM10011529_05120 [Polymorphobacter glacialis]
MSMLQDAKLAMMGVTHLDKDALHIHIGLAAFFAAALVLRWPIGGGRPWLAALALAVGGEIWDIIDTARVKSPQIFYANWHDVWNTLLWPTAVTLLARWTQLLQRR